MLNRANSTKLKTNGQYSDPSAPDPTDRNAEAVHQASSYDSYGRSWCVRDVSWHGYEPTLMSTCWEVDSGYRQGGTVAQHEWKGLGKGVRKLEDWVDKQRQEVCG